ncbi:MAG: hypothetical protein J6X44_14110, partial [Thermoguttaceae bacterium]|nr:hypothetical protein [Thermoguttaceae bacterium]
HVKRQAGSSPSPRLNFHSSTNFVLSEEYAIEKTPSKEVMTNAATTKRRKDKKERCMIYPFANVE